MMENRLGTMESGLQDNPPDLNSGFGWDDYNHLHEPNTLNSALLKEIRETQRQLLELDNELKKNKEKSQSKEQFIQNLKETNKNTQAFIKMKESEIEIENHFLALKNGTKDQLAQKNAKMMDELKFLTEKETKLNNCIFNAKEKLDKCRRNKNWDQQTMEAFYKESTQKHDEMMALIRYAHQDDRQIISLTKAIEKEAMDVGEHRKAFDKAMTENKSAQIALDKAKDNLHQALMDTQQFSNHWETSSKQMELPDVEIQKCAQILEQTCQDVRERKLTLSECKHLLTTQKNNTKKLESSLMLSQQQVIELQQHLDTEDNNLNRLQNELQSCQNDFNKATSEVKSLRARISQIKKEMRVKDDRFKPAYSSNVPLKRMLQVVTQTTLSKIARAAQMKQFLALQQQALKELHLQLRVSMQKLIDSKRHLEASKASEKRLTIKVSESKSTINILQKECRKHEEEQWRLEKDAFQQDSEIAELENILAQLQGDASSDGKQIMEGKIAELKKDLEEKGKEAKNLKHATKETERELKRLNKDNKRSEAKKADLFSKNNDLLVLCRLTEKELIRLRFVNREQHVKNQLTKTETEGLHDLLHKRTKSAHSSEIKKLDLLKAMKERELEIKAQKEMLSRQLQITDQERHKLRFQLNEELRKLEIVKNRCEILVSSILPEVEAEEAQAYCITKFAQEKEELLQKQYALNAKIQKVKLENEALGNTNLLWQLTTSSIRQNLNRVDQTSSEYQEKLRLEERLKEVQDVLKSKKREIRHLQADMQEKEKDLEGVQYEEKEVKNEITIKQHFLAKLQKQAHVKQESINRLNKQCYKRTKQIRQAKNIHEETLEEKDIRLKEAKQLSNNIDKMLTEAMDNSPDLRPVLEGYFKEANVPFPSPSLAQSIQWSSSVGFRGSHLTLRSPASSCSRSSAQSTTAMKTVMLSFNPPSPQNTTSGGPSIAGWKSTKPTTTKRLA